MPRYTRYLNAATAFVGGSFGRTRPCSPKLFLSGAIAAIDMGRINGWKRRHHYETLAEAKEHLNAAGRVTLAAWVHDDDGRVEYIYEPDADKPFIVRQSDPDLQFEEEGRYTYRYEGGQANKDLLRKYP